MFEVIPEPEFSAWFDALPDPYAEEVAAAIDLTAAAAPTPGRLSRMLLWYDGSNGETAALERLGHELELGEAPAQRLRDYLSWHHEVVLCLESPAFHERLSRLDAQRAEQALRLVELLKHRLQAARLGTTLNPWHSGMLAQSARLSSDWARVRESFEALLQSMGMDSQQVQGSGSGLRELTLGNIGPPLRILFGLDFPAQRLLVILGETLDRSYYGDSVRRAEQRWQDYVLSRAERLEPSHL